MIVNDMRRISKDSTISALRTYDVVIKSYMVGELVSRYFLEKPNLPGILIVEKGELIGMISREFFFEKMGRAYGIEIYATRSIKIMLDECPYKPLILPSTSHIGDATKRVLDRPQNEVYQPIVVQFGTKQFAVLDVVTLFIAQNLVLQELNAQRYYTVDTGLPLSDQEANELFLEHVHGQADQFSNLNLEYTVRCDRCGEMIHYRIADIIRSFPQIEKGIFVEQRMGSVFFTMYVRHRCGNQIVEIPVHHDEKLEYRNHRNLRLIEAYA